MWIGAIAIFIIGFIIGKATSGSLNVGVTQKINQTYDSEWGEQCYKGEGCCLSKNCEQKGCQMKNKDYSPIKHRHGY